MGIKIRYTVSAINAERMYCGVKFGQTQKVVNYFLQDASESDKEKVEKCLDLVKFGMASMLVTFEDQEYWICGGDLHVEEKSLTIGEFKSAFFVDLVPAYLLESLREMCLDSVNHSIYCDNGINTINKKISTEYMVDWLEKFQAKVNKLTGSEYLKFTVDIGDPDST